MTVRVHSGLSGPFSARPATLRQPGFTASRTRLTSAPAYEVLVSRSGRSAAGNSALTVRDSREAAILESVDATLVTVGADLRRMRLSATVAGNTKLTSADRNALLDRVVAATKEIARLPRSRLGGSAPMPEVSARTASALASGSLEARSDYGGNAIVDVDVTRAAPDATFALNRAGASNALRLTNVATGQSQDIALHGIAGVDGTKTLAFDELGVTITVTGSPESSPGALATAMSGRSVVTKAGTATGSGALTATNATDAAGASAIDNPADAAASETEATPATVEDGELVALIDNALDEVTARREAVRFELRSIAAAAAVVDDYRSLDPAVLTGHVLKQAGLLGLAHGGAEVQRLRSLLYGT